MAGCLITVVETPEYLRRAKAAGMSEEDRADVLSILATNPTEGMSLGGGLYKMRVARPGGGKSGGWRVLHFFRSEAMPVFLLTVFAKNEKANLTTDELASLLVICDKIASSYRRRP